MDEFKSVEIGELLYRRSDEDTVTILDQTFSVGESGAAHSASFAAREKARAAGVNVGQKAPKYSVLIHGLKALLEGKLQVAMCDKHVIISMEGNRWFAILLTEGGQYSIYHNFEGESHQLIGCVLIALVMTRQEVEGNHRFEITEGVLRMMGTTSNANFVVQACDAFYYEMKAAKMDALVISESPNTVQAFLDKSSVFKPFNSPYKEYRIQGIPSMANVTSSVTDEVYTEYNALKKGEYFVNYTFTEEAAERIPGADTLEQYVPSRRFLDVLNILKARLDRVCTRLQNGESARSSIRNTRLNIKFTGVPGTGKSVAARALAAALGLPFRTVPLSAHAEEDTFTGKTLPADGGLKQFPTEFLEAFEYGGIVVLEEANMLNPGVAMCLSQALEEPYVLLKNGVEPVYRHPLCVVIAAYNPGLAGTQTQNDAFLNRFPMSVEFGAPSEEEQMAIIKKLAGIEEVPEADDIIRAFYNVYYDVMNIVSDPNNDAMHTATLLSFTRNVVDAVQAFVDLRHGKIGGDVCKREFEFVARTCFINDIVNKDQEVGQMVLSTIGSKMRQGLRYQRIMRAASGR